MHNNQRNVITVMVNNEQRFWAMKLSCNNGWICYTKYIWNIIIIIIIIMVVVVVRQHALMMDDDNLYKHELYIFIDLTQVPDFRFVRSIAICRAGHPVLSWQTMALDDGNTSYLQYWWPLSKSTWPNRPNRVFCYRTALYLEEEKIEKKMY